MNINSNMGDLSTSRSDMISSNMNINNKPQMFGPVIRTPNQKSLTNLANNQVNVQPPPAPIYQPAASMNNNNNNNNNNRQTPHLDMSNTVNSIVDTWEADLAKHVKRRPSGQLENCKIFSYYFSQFKSFLLILKFCI